MNRAFLAFILLTFALAPLPRSTASASCAAPSLTTADATLDHAGTQVVSGRAFTEGGCGDSQSCSTDALGCSSCTSDEPPTTPMTNVQLRLRQGDRTWDLAVADAGSAEDNELGWVTWTFDLPEEVRNGPAKLLADHAEPLEIRIR